MMYPEKKAFGHHSYLQPNVKVLDINQARFSKNNFSLKIKQLH